MKKSGWYGDSWRHGLAAKGIKSNMKYFQQKSDIVVRTEPRKKDPERKLITPATKIKKAKEAEAFKRFKEQQVIEARKKKDVGRKIGQEIIDQVALGDTSALVREKPVKPFSIKDILSTAREGDIGGARGEISADLKAIFTKGRSTYDALSPAQKLQVQAEANTRAVELAAAGLKIPPEVRSLLTSTTKREIDALEKQMKEATRTPGERAVREIAREGIRIGEEKIRRTEGEVRLDQLSEAQRLEQAVRGNIAVSQRYAENRKANAESFPFLDFDNVFLGGDGDPGIGKLEDNGKLNFYPSSIRDEPTSPLSSAIVPKEKFRGPDFGVGSQEKTFADRVSDQVESLWSARKDLGKVDKNPLMKGEQAFKEGNREILIEAINEQESQLKQQQSRWNLANQTRQLVETSNNRQSIFEKPEGFSLFSGSGGRKIAEQTKKIHQVQKEIKQGADDARTRVQVLRGNLKRLDATIPFDESVPGKKAKVFEPAGSEFSFEDLIKQRGLFDERE